MAFRSWGLTFDFDAKKSLLGVRSFVGVNALCEGWPGNPGSDGASPYHPFDALSLAQSRT
jgi:hypothetical protein